MSRYLDDIAFFFDEVIRFREMSLDEWRETDPIELLHAVRNPNGSGSTRIGSKANYRLQELIEWELNNLSLIGVVDEGEILSGLQVRLLKQSVDPNRKLDEKFCHRALSQSIKKEQARVQRYKHYFVCNFLSGGNVTEFAIGSVRFICLKNTDMKKWFSQLIDSDETPMQSVSHQDIKDYYFNYNWLVEVVAPLATLELSKKTAFELAQTALYGFLLVNGGAYHKASVGYGTPARNRSFHLAVNESLEQHRSGRIEWEFIPIDDNWEKRMKDKGADYPLELLSVAFENAYNFANSTYLAKVFVKSLKWYGEAVLETDPEMKVCKFVFAIERILLVQSNDKSNLSAQLLKRALFLSQYIDLSYSDFEKKFAKIYKLRSRIVHGDEIQPSELFESMTDAANISQEILLGALYAFNSGGGLSNKKLTRKSIVKAVNSMEQK